MQVEKVLQCTPVNLRTAYNTNTWKRTLATLNTPVSWIAFDIPRHNTIPLHSIIVPTQRNLRPFVPRASPHFPFSQSLTSTAKASSVQNACPKNSPQSLRPLRVKSFDALPELKLQQRRQSRTLIQRQIQQLDPRMLLGHPHRARRGLSR